MARHSLLSNSRNRALLGVSLGVAALLLRPRRRIPLQGRVVVITGASSGIGREAALECARRGARLVVAARNEEKLAEVVQEIEALGAEALAVPTDVAKREDVQALVKRAREHFGRIDVMVNHAGGMFSDSVEHSEEWRVRELIETNVMGVLYGVQEVLPVMRQQGGGHIINTGSVEGRIGFPYSGVYGATKAFVEVMTQSLRQELMHIERSGIYVTSVLPAAVRTPLFDTAANVKEGGEGLHLVGPVMEAEQVGRMMADVMERPQPVIYPLMASRAFVLLYDLFPGVGDFVNSRLRVDEQANPLTHAERGTGLSK